MNAQTFISTLPTITTFGWNEAKTDWVERQVKPHAFVRDGLVFISTEEGDGAADYYGEFRGGCPWINPSLVEYAASQGGHWEWQHPGAIVFVEN